MHVALRCRLEGARRTPSAVPASAREWAVWSGGHIRSESAGMGRLAAALDEQRINSAARSADAC